MKFTKLLTAGMLTASLISPAVFAAETMSEAQKKDIEKVVHDYLMNNPEVLIEVSKALQNKEQVALQKKVQSSIQEQASELFNDKLAMVGNEKGKVTLVEFFDYQCIYCKKMAPVISELISKDNNIRVIFKEYPIFGDSSVTAARAALAAAKQGKYEAIHKALLAIDKKLTDDMVMETAKSVGLDMTKLKADMESKEISDILEANENLAKKLFLAGTPAFIIASTPGGVFKAGSEPTFIPGAARLEDLQKAVQKAGA